MMIINVWISNDKGSLNTKVNAKLILLSQVTCLHYRLVRVTIQ